MEHDKLIKDAQYRKGLSIAFFNATNAAIELVKIMGFTDKKTMLSSVIEARDFFLEEHKTYYANVIAKIGVAYKPEETKAKLSKAKSLEELKSVWLSLSEDERRDKEIIVFTQTLKKAYA
jgi:predicted S18 family serine protease